MPRSRYALHGGLFVPGVKLSMAKPAINTGGNELQKRLYEACGSCKEFLLQ